MKYAVAAACAVCASAGACTRTSHGSGLIVDVYAFSGELDPEPGATIIAHGADGHPIDTVTADAVGHGAIVIEDGAFITVVFPGDLSAISTAASLVTTPAPAAGSELDVHGPEHAGPPTVAGALSVAPTAPLAGADHFTIALGCTLSQVSSLPASIDVSSRCLGSDTSLDILVTGYQGAAVAGYAAGRVALVDGGGTFAPTAWDTTAPTVPVTVSGVTPAPALEWTLYADGLPFADQAITDAAPVPTGLAADSATLGATLGAGASTQPTTQYFSSVPSALAVGAADFLPAIAPSLVADGRTYSWSPGAAAAAADVLDLHLDWDATSLHVTWDVVLPPDAGDATLPDLTGSDLGTLITPPGSPPAAALRYLAAPAPEGFDAVVAAGLRVDRAPAPTIVPRPTTGELRVSQVTGFAP